MIDSLQLTTNPKDFFWVSQGVTTVNGMDDKEEFCLTDVGYLFLLKDNMNLILFTLIF